MTSPIPIEPLPRLRDIYGPEVAGDVLALGVAITGYIRVEFGVAACIVGACNIAARQRNNPTAYAAYMPGWEIACKDAAGVLDRNLTELEKLAIREVITSWDAARYRGTPAVEIVNELSKIMTEQLAPV